MVIMPSREPVRSTRPLTAGLPPGALRVNPQRCTTVTHGLHSPRFSSPVPPPSGKAPLRSRSPNRSAAKSSRWIRCRSIAASTSARRSPLPPSGPACRITCWTWWSCRRRSTRRSSCVWRRQRWWKSKLAVASQFSAAAPGCISRRGSKASAKRRPPTRACVQSWR